MQDKLKVLVTGGAGYMGGVVIPMLLDAGHEVVLFDNFMYGVKHVLHFATSSKVTIIEGDVRDADAVSKAVKDADCVMHMAAIVGYPACSIDPIKSKTVNVDGSRNVVRALSKSQMAIFASTGSTYGKTSGICDENTPIAPLTLYGSTKAEAERYFLDVGAVALRFATVFGVAPRLRLDLLINDFVYQALHNRQIVLFEGHFKRTFLHVRDAARSWMYGLDQHDHMRGQAYNIGDEKMNFTKREVAQKIAKKVKFYLHEADFGTDLDKRDYEVSYSKIKQLGYRAKVGINEGLDELIKILRHVNITSEWRNA